MKHDVDARCRGAGVDPHRIRLLAGELLVVVLGYVGVVRRVVQRVDLDADGVRPGGQRTDGVPTRRIGHGEPVFRCPIPPGIHADPAHGVALLIGHRSRDLPRWRELGVDPRGRLAGGDEHGASELRIPRVVVVAVGKA
jgi:hypothetical protein